jgi:hypothetical protein
MCKHYWLIEPANGSTSKGICKKCGNEQVFANGKVDTQCSTERIKNRITKRSLAF